MRLSYMSVWTFTKETIAVSLADGGGRGDARAFGQIVNTPAALSRLLTKLAQPGRTLKFCYEAGPCGYGIQRQLSTAGHDCLVVAPSLISRKQGDRIKTDRRDANNLARLHRAGELTAVWITAAAPMFDYFLMTPEGAELIRQHRNLQEWWARMPSRPSMAAAKTT